jgi:hypothetical protein
MRMIRTKKTFGQMYSNGYKSDQLIRNKKQKANRKPKTKLLVSYLKVCF